MSVVFKDFGEKVVGIGERGRRWQITESGVGWRLEFRDAGSPVATYADTYPSLDAAMSAAEGWCATAHRPSAVDHRVEVG